MQRFFSLYFGKKCSSKFIFILIFDCHYPFLHSNVNRVKGNCSMSIFFLSVKPFATESQMTEKNVLEIIDFLWQGIRLRTVSFSCSCFFIFIFALSFHTILSVKVNCSMSIFFLSINPNVTAVVELKAKQLKSSRPIIYSSNFL